MTIAPEQRQERLDQAIKCVAEASHIAKKVLEGLAHIREITKDDRSPVTVGDFAVQSLISVRLRQQDPQTRIVGEEHAAVLRQPERAAVRTAVIEAVRSADPTLGEDEILDAIDACDHDASADSYWTLDPIDGTKGFLRGQQFAIALGWIERGEVVLGVMGCPNLPQSHEQPLDRPDARGTIYAAAKGAGCWEWRGGTVSDEPRRVAVDESDPAAPIRVCESVESGHSRQSDTQRILEHLGGGAAPVRLDSQCKYAVVARGQADAYLRMPTGRSYVEKIWDHAAGMIIATEAGAEVSDIFGRALDFARGARLEGNRGVICATPRFHSRIIEAIDALALHATE